MAQLDPLHASSPRTIALVVAVFLLVIGLPMALFVFTGRPEVALGLLVVFAAMVGATAYGLKAAASTQREDQGPR